MILPVSKHFPKRLPTKAWSKSNKTHKSYLFFSPSWHLFSTVHKGNVIPMDFLLMLLNPIFSYWFFTCMLLFALVSIMLQSFLREKYMAATNSCFVVHCGILRTLRIYTTFNLHFFWTYYWNMSKVFFFSSYLLSGCENKLEKLAFLVKCNAMLHYSYLFQHPFSTYFMTSLWRCLEQHHTLSHAHIHTPDHTGFSFL